MPPTAMVPSSVASPAFPQREEVVSKTSLERLADRVGILPEYLDQTGNEVRTTSDSTRIAILRAMRLDCGTDAAARATLAELEARELASPLAPVRVRFRCRDASRVRLRLPRSLRGKVAWTAALGLEAGRTHRAEGISVPNQRGEIIIELGVTPPEGYHTLEATVSAGGGECTGTQSLIVVPRACRKVQAVFGVFANLYTVRSAGDWGVGDLSTLARLLEWTAGEGGDFVGVNPLHALRNRGWEVSPYSPVTRLYRNPIYLDPGPVPPDLRAEWESLRASDAVEYERVMALKRRALESLHAAFDPTEEYHRFVETEGESLERYATFEALVDHLGHGDWRRWPHGFRDPRAPEVGAFRAEHERDVDFHRWLQFELDRQLGAVAEAARKSRLPIGLYQDLAIGTSPNGADTWAQPELFIQGASIGAPPDPYSATGQNWGLPPIDPRALRADRYRYFIRLVRSGFRHAGALRIDHVMGLFRLFWIPEGKTGKEGAYVEYPSNDLLGILALESVRHDALVVGEDLGTVPKEVPPALEKWGVLSSKVLYFEREKRGFKAAQRYEPLALATANTHDMATLAGFWEGRDIEQRARVGLIHGNAALEEARRTREEDKQALLLRLAREEILPYGYEPNDNADLRGAIHEFLCRTPAALVGLALDDLAGEVDAVNLPGVGPDKHPSWKRKMALTIDEMRASDDVHRALRCGPRVAG